MHLKRGAERVSCDFCHQRKIKCDRSARISEGYDSCSQCALRESSCNVDDSQDIRLRKRKRKEVRGGDLDLPRRGQQRLTPDGTAAATQPFSPTAIRPEDSFVIQPSTRVDTAVGSTMSLGDSLPEVNANLYFPDLTNDFPSFDSYFDLSADSASFLDHIFMRDHTVGLFDSNHGFADVDASAGVPSASQPPEPTDDRSPQSSTIQMSTTHWPHQVSFAQEEAKSKAFVSALHAYFDWAALALPILFEDAFWADYNAGRCSPALVHAVACRGAPFTSERDRWHLQQRCANEFRRSFLQAQQAADSKGSIRLDDLEALALMVNFEYESDEEPAIEARLGSLFLTHDSLVLLMLQGHIETKGEATKGPNTSQLLQRAEQRRMLLYWHVFGLDAFRCLDTMRLSRIQDDHSDIPRQLPQSEAKGYLDAVLALAVVARKITMALHGPLARRSGMVLEEVQVLYQELEQWRNMSCPSHLHWSDSNLAPCGASVRANSVRLLHRAVLSLLQLNCYMQIESDALLYCNQSQPVLDSEVVALRVEYETLSQVSKAEPLFKWLAENQRQCLDTGQRSLPDLAPHILRNICAGVCRWLCFRVQRRSLLNKSATSTGFGESGAPGGGEQVRQQNANYTAMANMLRNVVSSAAAHSDTKLMVEHLDELLRPLVARSD